MPKLILPAYHWNRLIRRRRRLEIDHRDEVWNGVYVVSPEADNEHQQIGRKLANAIESALDDDGSQVFHGTNVSDRDDWMKNFRVPDVAVFLAQNPAQDRQTHWLGGPDLAVEVMSRGDRSRKKFDFYGAVGVRELILLDRRRWFLEFYRFEGGDWRLVDKLGVADGRAVRSEALSLDFRMVPGKDRPRIEVSRPHGGGPWLA